MKNKKFIAGIGSLVAVGGMLTACSSDYLEQPPIDSISEEMIGQSLEAARAALYGVCQAMNIGQYGDMGTRFMMGEGYIQTYYGDSPSPDFWDSFLWGSQAQYQAWALMMKDNRTGANCGWLYGYNLVGQANRILAQIDKIPVESDQEEATRKFIKAQTLTMRAHGYIRLMQIYGPRYEDRKDGDALCLVLREVSGYDALPLSTYDDCITFIEKDLDNAIALYNEATGVQRQNGFEPDLNICQGLYSRLALMNHEWEKAAQMAKDARTGYPIMSADEYKDGFYSPNNEWLWYNDPDPTYVGYNSWGASFACNGAYATTDNWSSSGCMSVKLFDQIYERNSEDVRTELYWMPQNANRYVNTDVKEEWFWDYTFVNQEFGYMYVPTPAGVTDAKKKQLASMNAAISMWLTQNYPGDEVGMMGYKVISITPEEAKSAIKRSTWNMKVSGSGSVQFGAQCKFYGIESQMGAVEHPFLRGAELLLNQAEAECEQGNYPAAARLLEELNQQRMPSYSCTLTGDELRDEIRLYRRMELWGEGDCWFSFKRWNLPITRSLWKEGDTTSDSFFDCNGGKAYTGGDSDVITWETDYCNGWRYTIPTAETHYNPLVADQLNKVK